MRHGSRRRAPERGMTLIEALIAMSVVLVGLLGFASLQIITQKANVFSKRLAQASAMASDLAENVKRWDYADPRLAPLMTVTSLTAPEIESRWDLGRGDTAAYTAQFSELASDSNASNPGALGAGFQGLSGDVDGDGQLDFIRYWNVYAARLSGTAQPNGKLVQVIVRWREAGVGFRQVSVTTYKPNPEFIFQ